MLKKNLLVAALASAFAMPAMAADTTFSSNVTLASDYLYRGISQTGTNPTIQGGFDLSHASGLYAGVWGSSISTLGDAGIPNSGTEIDTYGGYKAAAGDVSYDVGFLRYNYPGTYPSGATKADTNEVYGAVSYSIVTAKLSYSLGTLFGVPKSKGSTYAELGASYPVADSGIIVGAHYGKQTVAGTGNDVANYSDYKLSVTKDYSGYVVGAAYSSTDADTFYTNPQGKKLGKGTVVLSLTRAM